MGRVMEGTSEDPYLLSEFARAKIRETQGTICQKQVPLQRQLNTLQVMLLPDRVRITTQQNFLVIPCSMLFLPPFKAAVDEGAVI